MAMRAEDLRSRWVFARAQAEAYATESSSRAGGRLVVREAAGGKERCRDVRQVQVRKRSSVGRRCKSLRRVVEMRGGRGDVIAQLIVRMIMRMLALLIV